MAPSFPVRVPLLLTLVVLLAALAAPPGAAAQESCAQGRISDVEVRSLDPYGEDATDPDATFDWAFRALNWLHVETRERVIRWELLFEEGDCLQPLRLSETERNLRTLPYIHSATVSRTRLADGTYRVEVETRDSWALSASLGVDLEAGIQVTGIQGAYRNVLGSGLQLQLFRRSFRERLRYGVLGRHTNFFGTGIDAVVHGGETRSGSYFSQTLTKPFLHEFGDHAFRQVYAHRDDFFAYALPPGADFTPALLRYRADLVEMSYQTRLGPPRGARAIVGLGLSGEAFSAPFGMEGARGVVEGDFDDPVVAPDSIREAILEQAAPYSAKRLTLFMGLRDGTFETRGGLDAINAVQDLMVGSQLMVALGRSFRLEPDDHRDLLARIQGRFGFLGTSTYVMSRFDAHARHALQDSPGPGGWRDLLAVFRTDAYWTWSERASLYLRARVSGGWRTDRPFQLRLGGREGVRAYSEDAFPAATLILLSAEQRVNLEDVSPSFADLGGAIFVDAGRGWAGDAPFAADSGWETGIGIGLRASPAGSRRVLRADLTLPLTDQQEARGVVFRIHAEIFGVLDRRRWPGAMERSRWYGTDPDLSRRLADPLARN